MDRTAADLDIAALAERQHGCLARDQAVALGATDRVIQRRLETGRWVPVGKHVVRVAGAPTTWRQRLLAGVLDGGPGAVATGRPAAALWVLPGYPQGGVEVLRPRGGNHRPSLGTARETRSLPPSHVTTREGIPVLVPARLAVELAGREHPKRVERTVESAIAAGLLTPQQLARVVSELASRGRRGSTFLRELVEQLSPGYVPPASELEARFRDLLQTAGLPEPIRQLDVGGELWIGRVDVAYPERRLVIELDSRRWHDSRGAIESDAMRSNQLTRAGWTVLRITWRQLHDDPLGVVLLVRGMLQSAVAA